jgi:G8 domain/FG-GAP-like repeat
MNGVAIASTVGLLGPDPNWSVSHTADFNGDGKADLLWRNTNGAVTIWTMNGITRTAAAGVLGPDANWRVAQTLDLNGDNKADLVWRANDGSITTWLMNGTTIGATAGIVGAGTWNVAPNLDALDFDSLPKLLWSSPATWGGALPRAGDVVTIPAGKRILLDVSPPSLKSLLIEGSLTFDSSKDLNLTADWIVVSGQDSKLSIGSQNSPYTKRAVITLTGTNTAESVLGMGTKLLGAMLGAKIEIIGERRISWTQLAATATIGAIQITLKEPVDWRIGERLVIASSSMNPNEVDERNITAVSADRLKVTLDRSLQYQHFGQLQSFDGRTLDERAEVGLLSRNIVIQGDDASVASRFGGHVMIMGGDAALRETNLQLRSSAKIRGVEFRRLGQFDRLGRYPLHWHRNGASDGDFIEGSAVHQSFQRGIVVHSSDSVTVRDNVVYRTPGHTYVVEDGTERGNTFDRNLAILPQAVTFTAAGLKDQNDQGASNFWRAFGLTWALSMAQM